MANKLVLTFSVEGGDDKNFTYNHASSNPSNANVKALGAALINNGSFFQYPPVELKAAKLVTTTTTAYDLSNGE